MNLREPSASLSVAAFVASVESARAIPRSGVASRVIAPRLVPKFGRALSERWKGSKLTVDDVSAIRHRLVLGESASSLAECFEVSISHIGSIRRRAKWRFVD